MTREKAQSFAGKSIPSGFARPELNAAESIQTTFSPNLDADRHFSKSLLILTNQRLLFLNSGKLEQSWKLDKSHSLETSVDGGLGKLIFSNASGPIQRWWYTAAESASADRFIGVFRSTVRSQDEKSNDQEPLTCPSCGFVLSSDDPVCPSCTPTAAPPATHSLRRLAPFARRRASTIIWGLVLTVMATAAGLVPPIMTKPLTDDVLVPLQTGQSVEPKVVAWLLIVLAVAAVVAWVLGWAKTFVLALASEQVSSDLRRATYEHLQKLSLEFYGGRRTGDLISRISSDTDRICNFLSIHLVDFITDLLVFVFTAVVLVWIDPMLAFVTLLPFPAIAWLVHEVRNRLRHGFARATNAWSDMVSVLTDAIPGVRVVKAFAQESREIDRFRQSDQHVLDSNVSVNRLWAFFGPTVTLLTELGILVIWGFGVWRVATSGSVTVGDLSAFLMLISRFYVRLDSMSRMLANTQRAAASSYRIFEILDRIPSVSEPVKPQHPGRLSGRLNVIDLSFKYGNRKVLKGVSLQIAPGELIGLVGPSGSGKSTLVNLVCRFYDPTQGSILADNVDIRSFPLEEFRRNIGIVLQEPYLFYGTIAENISYGRPDASRGEIIAAAKAAHAHQFILRLAEGYDSLVGERGQSLSGGERQRISIARALLTDPRILILDEATSAVDNETEREIQTALDNLIRGRTTIAIAHRLSTLRNADRIVVLEEGRVVDIGKHEELLDRAGVYRRLYNAQLEKHEQVAVN